MTNRVVVNRSGSRFALAFTGLSMALCSKIRTASQGVGRYLAYYSKSHYCTDHVKDKKAPKEFATRVFSGIQPTGIPHLGNYLGAIKEWVRLQSDYQDVIYSIVDLHSITLPQDPVKLRDNILSMAACLLACGIDPDKSILFQQSQVRQHAELGWILGCLCTMPRLQHLPQWKEKSQGKEATVGLFTYPILQAADILLYKATAVPVGEDQLTHIELARDIAKNFNRRFGHAFPQPDCLIGDKARIKSLRYPENKMSKSESDPMSRIELTDSDDEIVAKLKKAQTDTIAGISYDPQGRPGVTNLIDIHSAFTGVPANEICAEFANAGKGIYKSKVAEVIIETVRPIREAVNQLLSDKCHLISILEKGQEKAEAIAEETQKEVKKLIGIS